MTTVKSLGLKNNILNNSNAKENIYFKIWKNGRKIRTIKRIILITLLSIFTAIILLSASFDVIAGTTTVGLIYTYLKYAERLNSAFNKLSLQLSEFINAKSAFKRFMTIYKLKIKNSDKGKQLKQWNEIEFKNVWFKYKEKYILKKFNLKIRKGDKIGIVGKTGSGKSTLIKLLLGLYQPEKGKILIDGININKYSHNSLLSHFSVVLQDSEIFNTTILENITITSENKDLKKINEAINNACFKEVIDNIPRKLEAKIGEKGFKLSGGEKQRLSLARTLYKNGNLLILDEATSALDLKTEKKVMRNLNKLNKTIIAISHRQSSLKGFKKIKLQ